jgi:hypothetical protein
MDYFRKARYFEDFVVFGMTRAVDNCGDSGAGLLYIHSFFLQRYAKKEKAPRLLGGAVLGHIVV